jgi:acyl dehydratase
MTPLEQGTVLFEIMLPPAGRARIADFARGIEDPNPIHIDDAFAHAAGFPTVLQQGPMTTAQFARLLEEHAGAGRTRVLDLFFTAPVFPDDSLKLRAEVTEVGPVVRCALSARKADGVETAKGYAELTV